MLYLGIDLHKPQITINLQNENGDVIQTGQISTEHDAINDFFAKLVKRSRKACGFMAIFEVLRFSSTSGTTGSTSNYNNAVAKKSSSFNPITPPGKKRIAETPMPSANSFGTIVNVCVTVPDPTVFNTFIFPMPPTLRFGNLSVFRNFSLRKERRSFTRFAACCENITSNRTRLHKSDMVRKKNRHWLETVVLPVADRIEMDIHLKLWNEYDEQVLSVESKLAKYYEDNPALYRLISVPGISAMGAITLISRIVDITRFNTPDSLANYFGLTPGCRNSGEATQRLGSSTKAGSRIARHVLNFAVNYSVRKCFQMKT